MGRDPWPPADVADAILGRTLRPSLPGVGLLPSEEEGMELEGMDAYDEVYVVMHETSAGIQPVIWPMLMHRHDNDCGRA